ncbi:hypothetical protein Syn7502_00888 [Synechococcus sp. PCC 7502]|uniref:hypothetical protein n=1 Tax=Synechococcus sp. PCC 7502 TaxID=1173263 RepID=UPI00029FF465|nr:hypothetical protein [Synechococcus sp. PCC 7502]AFY73011.1 hypothetical protein Syn7502_00888 [Synechococcus sp. PCC 7502]
MNKLSNRSIYLYLGLGITAIAGAVVVALLPSKPKLPNPTDALRQADQLSTEQLTQLEIDDQTRDRLRTDPQWQAIANDIRQDLIILKWGNGKLTNPVWQRYGAKAYPLLAYYARSRDQTRQTYGIAGIRSLGKPYTTIWLEQQLKRHTSISDFSLLTENVNYLLSQEGTSLSYESKQWEAEFNLNDPTTRDRLIKLAQQNLEPKNSPNYYSQFNLEFLVRLLGYEQVYGKYSEPPTPSVPKWLELEAISQPTSQQIQDAVIYFHGLTKAEKSYIFLERLGIQKAGEATKFTQDFLLALAQDTNSSPLEKIWAILELDRHDNKAGSDALQPIINGDFQQLYPLTQLVSYESYDPLGAYGYYLLLGITTKYPQSKFSTGCREYGDLTGKSYFGGEARPQLILDRIARRSSTEQIKLWQEWLVKYTNHPGADDAAYFLARSYQAANLEPEAVKVWAKMMITPTGDSDAAYLAFPHVRTQLDIGLSAEELQSLSQAPEIKPLAPLFTYALAVRFGRSQNYTKALELTSNLDIEQIPTAYLSTYYNSRIWYEEQKVTEVQSQIQKFLTEQRLRWQKLEALQKSNTPESSYQIASNWADVGGWKNGYFPLWSGSRTYTLPSLTKDNCQVWFTCPSGKIPKAIVTNYLASTQNAVALSLYRQILSDPQTPVLEKTLYMEAETLLEQWENHDLIETLSLHGLVNPTSPLTSFALDNYEQYEYAEKQMLTDYQNRLNQITAQLQQQFPNSNYIDDLLFSSYFLSKDRNYLRQIIEKYPKSDRYAEAKFLLAQPPHSS